MSPTQQAKVKSVLSGDTLVLTAVGNPRNERTLSLAYVAAPRMKRDDDETDAVESRDFIRRLLVGKVIQFRILYTLPTGTKRDYGQVTLQDGQQLPELSLAEGCLKLRDDAGKRDESEEATQHVEKLRVLESRAKADGKGLWDSSSGKIKTTYDLKNALDFSQRWKGKPLEAIVEKVLTGDRLIVRLMETPTQHTQTLLLIAGIRAPNTKRVNASNGQEQPGEPLGEESHDFVESRLLQRKVSITIVGVSPQNQLVGSVKHPNGDISVFILKQGLARCVDHHSTMLGTEMTLLRQAEKFAKDNGLGQFQGHVATKPSGREAEAIVSRIQSAEIYYLRYPDGREKRVSLSSVRQPKPSDPKQAPFGAEAKEFARKRLIGKHVKATIDGKRAATEGFDEREMATLVQNGKNVALALVEAGYASVIRHRMDDTDRSPIYDELLQTESTAQADGKGMWSSKAPEAKQYVDYSENLEKAKRLYTLLSRQKRVPAIVDFVKGGSRFSVLVPRENAKLTLVLSGIQAPKSARNPNDTSEPFGNEAHELANRRCQQRDVEIDVEDTDKVGGFIGKIYVNRENFAKILLEEGYASVRTYSAEKSGNAAELQAAEKKAKDARKGIWENYDPSTEVDEEANGDVTTTSEADHTANGTTNGDPSAIHQAPVSKDYRDVLVTYVDPTSCRLKIQHVSSSTTDALSSLTNAFRSFHLNPTSSTKALTAAPKAGDLLAARFTADNQWYRARVRRNDREAKTSEIVYVDYGNNESLPWSELRPLGPQDQFGFSKLKAQAQDAALSFVQFPAGSQEYLSEAQEWLERRWQGGDAAMVARVDHTDQRDGTLWVSIFDPNSDAAKSGMSAGTDSINAEVIAEGLGMVGRKLSRWEKAQGHVLEGLRTAETEAKAERRGMWEYGDLTED
ncbi:MAG: hypothetical protein M1828_000253 [Chrysothrix sp. TS-e1954]|nr:MAG: hypothetical protein M1828_000253 [Chrysothrix sp. TS-e1954]